MTFQTEIYGDPGINSGNFFDGWVLIVFVVLVVVAAILTHLEV